MKGVNYLASVLRVYRAALNKYAQAPDEYSPMQDWFDELAKVSHRGYTTGFLLGAPQDVGQAYHSDYIRTHTVVGVVEELISKGTAIVGVRNQFFAGSPAELLGPAMRTTRFNPDCFRVLDEAGDTTVSNSANPNQRIIINVPDCAQPLDLIRIAKEETAH